MSNFLVYVKLVPDNWVLIFVALLNSYVSCNPETLLANAVELCTPSGTGDHVKGAVQKGPCRRTVVGLARQRVKSMPVSSPFSPMKAVAVDMFPHTPHCEVIMLMER